jgi:beta-lactamase regulating signal transducer with metallopeptidase domain
MLLPMALLDRLNDSQRAALLLHELVHIRRGDHLVRMLELAVGVVYWWLPIVGPIGRRLRACEERCCDGAVVARLPHQRRDYAQLLLDVVEFANPLPREAIAQASSMGAADDLEQRLIAILDAANGARNARPAGMLAIVVACAIVPCQLRYDMLYWRPAPSVPAAKASEVEPAPGATPATSDECQVEIPDAFCCPS